MAQNNNKPNKSNDAAIFRINRVKSLSSLYEDEVSRKNRSSQTLTYSSGTYTTAAQVRAALESAIANKETIVQSSKELYITNPIYASVINYLANMFTGQYKVVPHRTYTKSKSKAKKVISEDDYRIIYGLMVEIVDGLSIETLMPELLTRLFINGATYFTTVLDEESLTISTLILPEKYCRTIGQTQYGSYIIQFDCSYFTDLGYNEPDLKEFLKGWPKDIQKAYRKYLTDGTNARWATLDPAYSSAVLLNEKGIPTLFYLYGGILAYEQYQDNELERNENLLRYLVVHTIPHYEDQLLFEVDEVRALHKSLKKIVDNGDKSRLITTYGDVHVDKISQDADATTETLLNAYKAIFNNAGFNANMFTSDSVTALKMALVKDKTFVWKFLQMYINFYNVCVNSWIDFKGYEVNIDLLPISLYTYDEDVMRYKDNATLGIGKVDYLIASGTKQRHIQDMFTLEQFLQLDQIQPLQTSYTQTAEDRSEETEKESADSKDSEIEPSETEDKNDTSSETSDESK